MICILIIHLCMILDVKRWGNKRVKYYTPEGKI